jgi:hypothetical protein
LTRGEIRTCNGDAVEPISEIELELKKAIRGCSSMWCCNCSKLRQSASRRAARPNEVIDCLEPIGLVPQAVRVGPIALDNTKKP